MGNACRRMTPEQKAAMARSKAIEQMTKNSFENDSRKIKLLLLGAGESGKSTLFKQMKILYGISKVKGKTNSGFSEKDRVEMRQIVHQNILFNFKQLLQSPLLQPNTSGEQPFKDSELTNTALELGKMDTKPSAENPIEISKEFGESLAILWKNEVTQAAWNDRGNLQVQDALEYYMQPKNLERILGNEYMPNDQDILRSRVRTSGIVEEEFEMNGSKFLMVDVGGQRNERRKWIHAFEDVDSVIFVAAISEYNQQLYEDASVRRQDESVNLFHKIANEKVFRDNGLVLFLNKVDLFREKLMSIPFKAEGRNEDYNGPVLDYDAIKDKSAPEIENMPQFRDAYEKSLQYLENLYKKQVPSGKQVYIKTTCATDTKQIEHIMEACKDIFLRRSLKNTGFM